MKITLDIDQLLADEAITQAEYQKLSGLAAKSTGSLAFNLLIGFGVIAVSCAALALAPAPATAIIIGLFIFIAGLVLLHGDWQQWSVLSTICILVGALMAGGGVMAEFEGSLASILSVAAMFAIASLFARSSLLAILATLMLSASVGVKNGYFEVNHLSAIQEPATLVILFSLLAIGLYQLSKQLTPEYEKITLASARTSVLLVNFGFWLGSFSEQGSTSANVLISNNIFAVLWLAALVATATWAWKNHRRWVLNTTVIFAGIHFYTQWFEHLGASPTTLLIAGLLALGFAMGLQTINQKMKSDPSIQ